MSSISCPPAPLLALAIVTPADKASTRTSGWPTAAGSVTTAATPPDCASARTAWLALTATTSTAQISAATAGDRSRPQSSIVCSALSASLLCGAKCSEFLSAPTIARNSAQGPFFLGGGQYRNRQK